MPLLSDDVEPVDKCSVYDDCNECISADPDCQWCPYEPVCVVTHPPTPTNICQSVYSYVLCSDSFSSVGRAGVVCFDVASIIPHQQKL